MQHHGDAGRRHSKHCPLKEHAARGSRAEENTEVGWQQPGDWQGTVGGKAVKRVKRGQGACCIDLECHPLRVRPTYRGGTVEIAVAPLH